LQSSSWSCVYLISVNDLDSLSQDPSDKPSLSRSRGNPARLEATPPETRSHQLRSNASCMRTGMKSNPSYRATASRICAVLSLNWYMQDRSIRKKIKTFGKVYAPQERRRTSLRSRHGSSSRLCSFGDVPFHPLARRSPRSRSMFCVRGRVGRKIPDHRRTL
jgi:hypothetical protein